tara:strand:+ start:18165 stop:19595 length:1431 start_codon:yes stop_codon:yes gene_type:complete
MIIPDNTSRFYIDGKWIKPIGSRKIPVENPATGETVAEIALGDAADVDRAVVAARQAFPTFSATSVESRLELLRRIIDELEVRTDRMARLTSLEIGSPFAFSLAFHVKIMSIIINSMVETLHSFAFEEPIDGGLLVREPIGVCGLIVPWNAPLAILAGKVATAIAAGCTMVVKPSELSPLGTLVFAEALDAAGVPKGVFNLINGDGTTAGQRLTEHPDVDFISFTGSTRAGRLVSQSASSNIKHVHLELGGKSANIVLPGVNLEEVVTAGVARCYVGSGQSCQAPTRMLVHRDEHRDALEIAAAAAATVRLGDPFDAETTMGPVISQTQFGRVQTMIESGISEGATLVTGGLGRAEGLSAGYFVRPTIFGNVRPDMKISREEIFGPVLSILPYNTEEEAVQMANDSDYGLAGWVWSDNEDRARRVARAMRTGRVYINGAAPTMSAPFGGYRMSGNGRENGAIGLSQYLEVKALLGY